MCNYDRTSSPLRGMSVGHFRDRRSIFVAHKGDCLSATPLFHPSFQADTVYVASEQQLFPRLGPWSIGTRTMTVIRIQECKYGLVRLEKERLAAFL